MSRNPAICEQCQRPFNRFQFIEKKRCYQCEPLTPGITKVVIQAIRRYWSHERA